MSFRVGDSHPTRNSWLAIVLFRRLDGGSVDLLVPAQIATVVLAEPYLRNVPVWALIVRAR